MGPRRVILMLMVIVAVMPHTGGQSLQPHMEEDRFAEVWRDGDKPTTSTKPATATATAAASVGGAERQFSASSDAENDDDGEEGGSFFKPSKHKAVAVAAAEPEQTPSANGEAEHRTQEASETQQQTQKQEQHKQQGMVLSSDEELPVSVHRQPRLQQLMRRSRGKPKATVEVQHGQRGVTPVTSARHPTPEKELPTDDRPLEAAREEEAEKDAQSGLVSHADCGDDPDITFGSMEPVQAGRCLAFLWMKPGCTADGTAAPSLKDWEDRTMRDAVVSFVLAQQLSNTEEVRAQECCGAHKGMCAPGIHRRDATAQMIDDKHATENAKRPTSLTPEQQRQYAIDKRTQGKNAVTPIGKPAVQDTSSVGCVKAALFRELEGSALTLLQHRPATRWLRSRYITVTNEAELREALNQGDVWITFRGNTDILLTQDLDINQPYSIIDGRGHYVRIRPSPALLALAVQEENPSKVPTIRISTNDVVLTGITFEGFTLVPEGNSWLTGCGGHGPGQPLQCYPLSKVDTIQIDEEATALWIHRVRFVRCGRAIVMKKFDKQPARLGSSESLGTTNVRVTKLQVAPNGVVNTQQSHPPQTRHRPLVLDDSMSKDAQESFREVASSSASAMAGRRRVTGALTPAPAPPLRAPAKPRAIHAFFHSPDEEDNDDIEAVSQLNAENEGDHSPFYPVQATFLQTSDSPEGGEDPGDGTEEARKPIDPERREDMVLPKQITVSWCFFDTVYDGIIMDEAGLLTLHHTYFNSTFRRSPMCNGGESRVHVYNVWDDNFGYWGASVRNYCQAMVEGSTFTRGPHTHPKHFAVECVDKGKAILRDVYAPGGVLPQEPCVDGTAFDLEPCTDYKYTVGFDPDEEQKCSIPVGCALEDVPHDKFHEPEDRKRCIRLPRWREIIAEAVVPTVVQCQLPPKAVALLPEVASVRDKVVRGGEPKTHN